MVFAGGYWLEIVNIERHPCKKQGCNVNACWEGYVKFVDGNISNILQFSEKVSETNVIRRTQQIKTSFFTRS